MEKIAPDFDASVAFLKRWRPGGPWVLTAIQVDRKAITTETFHPKDEAKLLHWLQQNDGKRNIYFQVNPPLKDVSKKCNREDIKELAWLHVDVDPRAGEDPEKELQRILSLLKDKRPNNVPEPTTIIFSGGGFQAFWRLEDPVQINGDVVIAEDVKRYNQQLEIIFGGDNCHNVDRIMRLPGSVNLPDVKKRKKGRTPKLARLIQFHDVSYPISDFTPVPTLQFTNETGFFNETASISWDGARGRIVDVNELDQWSVPDRIKVIIVQGNHPDEKKERDNSRSAWLFDCICNLLRCSVPIETILSILTDPGFGISESVLDKGVNAEKYVVRQIARAKDHITHPLFGELNERHAVIRNIGGRCRIVEEIYDEILQRTRLTRQSFEDFRNFYSNKQVQVGTAQNGAPILKKLGNFWLEHPERRQYDTVVFAPGRDVPGSYNLWKGFACQSKTGDCSRFLEHIQKNICSGNETHYAYLMGWLAKAVQQPASQGEVAVVLRGGRGTGKSFFAKHFGYLFGRHFLQVSNPSHLIGNFNNHLRDVVVLFADEAFYAGDKKHTSILKTLITEDTITIEAKGIDAEAAPNFVHLILASNDDHVVPAGGDERRFFVLDVGKENKQDQSYFSAIAKQLREGGYEALLHHLLTLDLTDFHVRNVPPTKALHDQKLLSLSPEEEWWYQRLSQGRTTRNAETWEQEVQKDALVDDYLEHTKRFSVFRRGSETALGKFLAKIHPNLLSKQRWTKWEERTADGYLKTREGRRYFWRFPKLQEARRQWETHFGPEEWPEAHTSETPNDPF